VFLCAHFPPSAVPLAASDGSFGLVFPCSHSHGPLAMPGPCGWVSWSFGHVKVVWSSANSTPEKKFWAKSRLAIICAFQRVLLKAWHSVLFASNAGMKGAIGGKKAVCTVKPSFFNFQRWVFTIGSFKMSLQSQSMKMIELDVENRYPLGENFQCCWRMWPHVLSNDGRGYSENPLFRVVVGMTSAYSLPPRSWQRLWPECVGAIISFSIGYQ